MPKVSRNPLAFRARTKRIVVVVDADNPEAGTARVSVCEIPKGLLMELRGDAVYLQQEVEAFDEKISLAKAKGENPQPLREKRKEANRALINVRLQVIKWGVFSHEASDFESEETGDQVAFEEEIDTYDGVQYRVVSRGTLLEYGSAGDAFVKALFDGVNAWQRGEVQPPEEVWRKAKEAKERRAQRLKETIEAALSGKVTEEAPAPPLA